MAGPRCRNCGSKKFRVDLDEDGRRTDEHGRCVECREFPTLGFLGGDWIEANCVIPDGDMAGDPYGLTDEMFRFLLFHDRIDPFVKRDPRTRDWGVPFFYVRGSQLARPQKWGKGPFASAIICKEAAPDGPARFDGWDADGQPVARPWATPHIQVTAASEDQADNVWGALVPMIQRGVLAADIVETFQTIIYLPSGGKIEPVTSSWLSRLGQRIVLAVQDQTESWTYANKLRKLADTQRRGIAGMGGRWLSTCNMWDPTEDSVAQYTAENELDGVYHDVADPGPGSITNKRELRRMLKKVYGDSWWVNLDRIQAEAEALAGRDPAQVERFYCNRAAAGIGAAFDKAAWDALAEPTEVPARALVTIGVHGARFRDAIAARATVVGCGECDHCTGENPHERWTDCELHGYQWTVAVVERPEKAPANYSHPVDKLTDAVADVFARFNVWRMYVSAYWIEDLLEAWQGRWGDKVVLPWFTSRLTPMSWAVRHFTDAIANKSVTHDGDPVCGRHIANAHKDETSVLDENKRKLWVLQKESDESPRSINAASASVASWEARGDAVSDQAEPPPRFDVSDYRIERL